MATSSSVSINKTVSSRAARIKLIYDLLYESFGERHWWPADSPFEVMVGAILTQNTAWTNVEKAMANLKRADVLSPLKLYRQPVAVIAGLIRSSGFYNQKAGRLKLMTGYLVDRYHGSIDEMRGRETDALRRELLSIKGIGKETADSILLYACGKPVFVVDGYTYRVFSRHGLVDEQMGYDDIQAMFMDNLAHEPATFNEYHALIVELAKRFCKTKPLCDACPLAGLPRYV